ncbi:MAG: SCP2 sterol-binding domain-containing protein [Rubrivivax sp.]|nr:SCP2 sterol-binding domain-containing protein [Rubrivivax sp.]
MNRHSVTFAATALAAGLAAASSALAQTAPVAMSAPWALAMCSAWNADATLTDKLVESGWVRNDGGRGFKAMQIYRADCPNAARVELQIALKDDKAQCVYGGAARTDKLASGADYLMWADTPRWREMGAGEYGPMRAMMFGRLNFEGPKMEAMGNMGPFGSFLLLVGKVPGDWAACP